METEAALKEPAAADGLDQDLPVVHNFHVHPPSQLYWAGDRYAAAFVLLLVLIEVCAALLGVPLPGVDFAWYTEPAFFFAADGIVRAPSLCHFDPTFCKCWGWYPPGFPVLFGAWLRLAGTSEMSIRSYHHLFHLLSVVLFYCVLLRRFGVARRSAALASLLLFPWYGLFGRPDFTSICFGMLAWLTIAVVPRPRGIGTAACLLACSGLVSPVFGGQYAAIVATEILTNRAVSVRTRLHRFILLTGTCVAVFLALWAIFLFTQPTPRLLLQQFLHGGLTRAAENSNLDVSGHSRYAFWFFVVPFVLGTALLVLAAVLKFRCAPRCDNVQAEVIQKAGIFFVASLVWWLCVSAQPFIFTGFHFGMSTKLIFLAALLHRNNSKAIGGLVLLSATFHLGLLLYYEKANVYYAVTGRGRHARTQNARLLSEGDNVAVDELLWSDLYRPWRTLNAHWITKDTRRYRLSTSAQDCIRPDRIMISDFTYHTFGHSPVSYPGYVLENPDPLPLAFGRIPLQPFAVRVFTRIDLFLQKSEI